MSTMKINVKTLKGTKFEIQVNPADTVADVKKNIETVQGPTVYPAAQQILVHRGKVLEDATTMDENKVVEKSLIVIMLSKSKSPASALATTSAAPEIVAQPAQPEPSSESAPNVASSESANQSIHDLVSGPVPSAARSETNVYDDAASNLVEGSNLEATIQQFLEMGGGNWDRETVIRALRAAFNNPEKAVDYLYSGIPEKSEVASMAQPSAPASQPPAATSAIPLDFSPQGIPSVGSTSNASAGGALSFLRNNQQFQAFRSMVQASPDMLEPMLQELGKQNPNLLRLIRQHQADFLTLINESPVEGNVLRQQAVGMPDSFSMTPEEYQAVERLEAMGFNQSVVLEVFLACNKNEELAANYLLDHMHDF